jgi:UDP-N-acetylmuramoyl-L-alanyl-D-glutamate--2,6-diaminopimelate ligase
MRLGELLTALGTVAPWGGDAEIGGIAIDSRRVQPGDVFFALPGTRTDGRQHVAEAIARGARAVVTAGEIDAPGVPIVRSEAPARLLGLAAAHLAGDPSASLTLVGVTGTNGKTTTTYLLEAIWRAAGLSAGVLGTIDYRFAGTTRPAPLTTPDALSLQTLLAEMRAAGATHVVMEVSSHALAQERVAGCRFDAAVFTNLTRDHMDFHADFDDYRRAKLRLFDEHLRASGKPDPVAIVNADDPVGAALAADVATRCVPYGRARYAAVRPLEVTATLAGTRGTLELGGTAVPFRSRLVGAPHVENILAAVATAWALGADVEAITAGIAEVSVPGRLEHIPGPGFSVLVDYAHTPDALARSLEVVRPLAAGRVIVVFGCGGDRDRGKRPLMGEAAARLADVVVLTSDNPRTEEPVRIIAEIEGGVRGAGLTSTGTGRRYLIEPDRRAAIALAIGFARPGDIVLVAGKGHEDYQIVGTEKRHLDDRQEVRAALAAGRTT